MNPIQAHIDPTVVQKARLFEQLTISIRSRLPAHIAHRCWVSGLNAPLITITADSAEISSVIRHYQHEILKQVNEEYSKYLERSVTKVRLKVDHRLRNLHPQKEAETESYIKPTQKQLARSKCSELLEIIREANHSNDAGRTNVTHRR